LILPGGNYLGRHMVFTSVRGFAKFGIKVQVGCLPAQQVRGRRWPAILPHTPLLPKFSLWH
jgi:hypothetical protein